MSTPPNEYFIEKRRIPVTVVLDTGEQIAGELFTLGGGRGISALEDAPEYLNGEESFIPCRLDDGSTRLVAKAHIVSVTTALSYVTGVTLEYGERSPVTVTMAAGAEYHGDLLVEQMVAHARVLDYLNHASDRFITLYGDEHVVLLNRDHVVFVREAGENGNRPATTGRKRRGNRA
jgi:hypothetical protein